MNRQTLWPGHTPEEAEDCCDAGNETGCRDESPRLDAQVEEAGWSHCHFPERLRSGALLSVAWNAWLGFLIVSIQIEIAIAIGIEIAFSVPIGHALFLNLVSSSAQPTEHRRHIDSR
jgi:hypothetical protein